MRKKVALAGLMAAVLGGLTWASPLALCDYKAPTTSLVSLTLSGSYRYFDTPATPGVEASSGRLGLSFSSLGDSPETGYALNLLGDLGLNALALSTVAIQGSGFYRLYLKEGENLFGFGGVEGGLATGQPQLGLRASAGVGFGRFQDVTPLAKAFRIQALLIERKAIPQSLPDDTLMAVAKEIGRRAEYPEVKDLAAAVVKLVETGAKVKLDPRTVLAVEDAILAAGKDRYCGWAAQIGLGYEILDPYLAAQDLVVSGSVDVAWPPEMNSQLLLRVSFSGPLDIVNDHTATANLSYETVLPGGILFLGQAVADWVKRPGQEGRLSMSTTMQFSFTLGMANVGVSLSLAKPADQVDWSLDVSVSFLMKVL